MKNRKYRRIIVILWAVFVSGCNYLDIVPDNIATIDHAFRTRATAEKYLATCYAYLPDLANQGTGNPALLGADEIWLADIHLTGGQYGMQTARGLLNVNSPQLDYWGGRNNGKPLFAGIRDCNIFLENIMNIPDMTETEKRQWTAEVKFLKAYYHFFLLRMYGPIPIIRENLPISASGEEVRVFRAPVDEVFNYIIELIEDAEFYLRDGIMSEYTELGRITLPIALAAKAKILVYAASPLFNGNSDYADFKGDDGKILFNPDYQRSKWQRAITALEEAIKVAEDLGYQLYEFQESTMVRDVSPETTLTLTYRGIVTERWNREIIWANPSSRATGIQEWSQPRSLTPAQLSYQATNGSNGVPMKVAELFYTKNGIPINEDPEWDYADRLGLRVGSAAEKYYIKQGYTTAKFNFDREPRFYGALGFDGGIWFGNGNFDDENPYWLESKSGQFLGKRAEGWHAVTGIWPKKLVYYTNVAVTSLSYSYVAYPWVMLRLGDLYLLYAEALNELNGPSPTVYTYIDKIRDRAGLPGVEASWQKSNRPAKHFSQDGLREIIHRERAIEMMFEGQRFWDLRRWKTAPDVLNSAITGWDVDQESNEAYYRQKIIFNQRFGIRDYFWPIREQDIVINRNLVQNPGW